jgi:hypothetical protein
MGSSDCHEADAPVYESAVPAIATVCAERGERRGTRREDAVSAANRKKLYREALD